MPILRYGINSHLQLDFPDGDMPGEFGTPRGTSLSDIAQATTKALSEPLDYPSLALWTTPGDRIAIVLDRAVPQASRVLGAVVDVLLESGVEPDGITVVQTQAARDAGVGDPCRDLPETLRDRIVQSIHDPNDRRHLAYLAAGETGEPILINRSLHEADVILPLGCMQAENAAGYFGIHSSIYPALSDAKTLQRFRGLGSLDAKNGRRRELTAEADHVAWLLGVNFTLQVVPANGDTALCVLCGEAGAVQRQGRGLYREAWSVSPSRRAALVVAAIEGDAARQSWENLGRALEAAGHFVEEGGSIAVCCDLETKPGPGILRLTTSSREKALRHVSKERPFDALPAAQLAHALEHQKVYLLSRLDPAMVEDLDVVPVADAAELCRLVRQYASCNLLSNASHVSVDGTDV